MGLDGRETSCGSPATDVPGQSGCGYKPSGAVIDRTTPLR